MQFWPYHSDISAPIRDLVVTATQDTITVEWNHDYYLCRNFTIYLDDTAVPECTNITALNCTWSIENLDTGMPTEVKVVVTGFGIEPAEASVMIGVQGQNSGMSQPRTNSVCKVPFLYPNDADII